MSRLLLVIAALVFAGLGAMIFIAKGVLLHVPFKWRSQWWLAEYEFVGTEFVGIGALLFGLSHVYGDNATPAVFYGMGSMLIFTPLLNGYFARRRTKRPKRRGAKR